MARHASPAAPGTGGWSPACHHCYPHVHRAWRFRAQSLDKLQTLSQGRRPDAALGGTAASGRHRRTAVVEGPGRNTSTTHEEVPGWRAERGFTIRRSARGRWHVGTRPPGRTRPPARSVQPSARVNDDGARRDVGLGERDLHVGAERQRRLAGDPRLDGGILDGDGAALRRPCRRGRRSRPRTVSPTRCCSTPASTRSRTAASYWMRTPSRVAHGRRGRRAASPAPRPAPRCRRRAPRRSHRRSGRRAGAAARSRGRTPRPARCGPGRPGPRRRSRRTRSRAAAGCRR